MITQKHHNQCKETLNKIHLAIRDAHKNDDTAFWRLIRRRSTIRFFLTNQTPDRPYEGLTIRFRKLFNGSIYTYRFGLDTLKDLGYGSDIFRISFMIRYGSQIVSVDKY